MFNIWINDGATEMPKDDIFYIISKEGIFLKKKLGLFESLAPVNKISILNELSSYATMNIVKIPSKRFTQILSFFRAVYSEYRSEANTILHYNQKKKRYRIEVPEQQVSAGSVNYESELSYSNYVRVGTIHSHANFSAFHSGVDKHDEATWDGIHMTIGNVASEYFSLSACIVANGLRFQVDPIDYIEDLELVEYESKVTNPAVGVSHYIDTTKKTLGYKINVPESYHKFPKSWFSAVSRIQYVSYYKDWKSWPAQGGLFDGVGNTIPPHHDPRNPMLIPDPNSEKPYTDMVHDLGEWNPCETCPFKDYKTELLMQEIFEEMGDDELEELGFVEVEDDGAELTVSGTESTPEHLKQEGYGETKD